MKVYPFNKLQKRKVATGEVIRYRRTLANSPLSILTGGILF